MRVIYTILALVIAAGFGAAASAFEQVPAAGATQGSGVASGKTPGVAADKPTFEFSVPDAAQDGSAIGTEIRMPGMGSIGMLPKLDFGLELLYGAAEKPAAGVEAGSEPGSEDVTIKGRLRHTF